MTDLSRHTADLAASFLVATLFVATVAPADDAVLVRETVDRGRDDADRESVVDVAASDARVATAVARLRAEGRYLPDLAAAEGPVFHPFWSWPLVNDRSGAFDPWRVQNFVDQDPAWPGHVLDYRCGDRTYDTNDGYNHTGVDISLWPFPWREKSRGAIEVVAAAAGQIVDRADGNPDDSCALAGGATNTIVLVHADGTMSYYRHLKNGSVTAKQKGDSVVRGEYLGRVASSGNSTGPHLHFASSDPDGETLEPYAGICNDTPVGMSSWWVEQPQYRPYRLVELSTHSETPDIPACPGVEQPHFKRLFSAAETVIVGVYLTDPVPGDRASFEVYRADGSLRTSFSIDHDEELNRHESYWQFSLPDILLPAWRGPWRIVATIEESGGATVTRERKFWVGALFADDFERVNLAEAGWVQVLPIP